MWFQPFRAQRAFVHSTRGSHLRNRFGQTGDLADLEKAVREYRKAVSLTVTDEPELPGRLNNLSNGLRDLYEQTDHTDTHYLEEAITISRQAVDVAPADYPQLPVCLNNLGTGLSMLFRQIPRVEYLEEAIDTYRKALKEALRQAPPDSPERPLILRNLSYALRERHEKIGYPENLEEAVRLSKEAVLLAPPDSPDLATLLANRGSALLYRYQRAHSMEDLNKAIQNFQKALRLLPIKSPYRAICLNSLAMGLNARYMRNYRPEDLEEAIHVSQGAMLLISPNSPYQSIILNLFNMNKCLPFIRPITAFIETNTWGESRRVLQSNPELLSNEADACLKQYQAMAAKYFNRMISWEFHEHRSLLRRCREIGVEQAFAEKGGLDSIPPQFVNNWSQAQRAAARYRHADDWAALDEAVDNWEQILNHPTFTTAPEDFRLYVLNDAGSTFDERYSINRKEYSDDLNHGLSLRREALRLTAANSVERAVILHNIGISLEYQYEQTRCRQKLDEAVQAFRDAMSLTPADSSKRPEFLSNLGSSLIFRYRETTHLEDLEEGIRICQDAVSLTPLEDPYYVRRLNILGHALHDRYEQKRGQKDLEEAIRIYDRSLVEIDHVFWRSTVVNQLWHQAGWAKQYVRAVEAHCQAGHADQALTIAEGSKSRVLATFLRRRNFLPPPAIPAGLSQRETALITELAFSDAVDLSSHSPAKFAQPVATPVEDINQRQTLVAGLREVWIQMEDYGTEAKGYVALRRGDRPDWKALRDLAEDLGPETALVSLFTTGNRTLLFVLQAQKGDPALFEYPLDDAAWEDVIRRFKLEVCTPGGAEHLEETWHKPLLPLFANIKSYLKGVRRLVVAPMGIGHLLPWGVLAQLAGLNLPVVTVPALGLLESVLKRPASDRIGTLVVGNPELTPKFKKQREEQGLTELVNLPSAEIEAQKIGKILSTKPLTGGNATKEAVFECLGKVGLAHFACHAHFDDGSPLDSGIVLADGILTAREIFNRGLRAPDFLVLSACETGKTGALAADEMAGLSQALFYAGARSLLVSLWIVNDAATSDLMTDFYKRWRNDRKTKDKTIALHMATEAFRNSARRKWDHTHYWGAFTLVGSWR